MSAQIKGSDVIAYIDAWPLGDHWYHEGELDLGSVDPKAKSSTSRSPRWSRRREENYGGEMTYDPPCGQKIVNVTWKDDDLWVLTRPMHEGEVPEVWSFTADSSFGVFEGTVTLTERVCS